MQDSQAEQTNNPMTTDHPMMLIEQQLELAKQELAKVEQAKQDLIDAELARLEQQRAKKAEHAKNVCDRLKQLDGPNCKNMIVAQLMGKKVNIKVESIEHLQQILSE
jgi:hypothetical protein